MKTKIAEIMDAFSDYVTSHHYEHTPMLTAYVNVDPTDPSNRRERPAWQIDLKNELARLQESMGEELKRREAQSRWSRVEEMLTAHLQGRKPTGRTAALFTGLDGDLIAFDLPVSVPTRLTYGLPQITDLLFALDQYKEYLVLLFSVGGIRAVEVFLTRTTGETTVQTEHEKLRRLGRKSMEAGQDRRGPEFERRFVSNVAADLHRYFLEDTDVERLVLGGNLQLAGATRKALHPAVKEIVVAMMPMDAKLSSAEIARVVRELGAAYEREHDLTVVADLVALQKRGGAVALGTAQVQEAMHQSRVRDLVVPYPFEAGQFDPLIVAATLKGIDIEFVYGDAARELEGTGGIGAYLYYRIGEG